MEERNKLLVILEREIGNKNIIKHMLATEACMKALCAQLRVKSENLKIEEEIKEEEWKFAGLMHDGDYREDIPVEQQGIKIVEFLKGEGIAVPENVAQAMAAHNWHNNGVEPKSKMDWALFCCDSLTGLIVACALVHPDKKLASVTVDSVLRKFPDKRFAAGTRREDIKMCEEKLAIPLSEFVRICLTAMQEISRDLGL